MRLSLDQRRVQLVAAAFALAERKGVAAVTARAVAAEAGVSIGVVHYCFESMDNLIQAMLEKVAADHLEAFLSVLELPAVGTGPQALFDLIDAALQSVAGAIIAGPGRGLVVLEAITYSLRQPDSALLAERARIQHDYGFALTNSLLVDLAERAHMRFTADVEILVRTILPAIDGAGHWWLVDRDDEVLRAAMRQLTHWIVDSTEPMT